MAKKKNPEALAGTPGLETRPSVMAGQFENTSTKLLAVEWLTRRYLISAALAGVIADLTGLGGRA
jgi:hypothetical protein